MAYNFTTPGSFNVTLNLTDGLNSTVYTADPGGVGLTDLDITVTDPNGDSETSRRLDPSHPWNSRRGPP